MNKHETENNLFLNILLQKSIQFENSILDQIEKDKFLKENIMNFKENKIAYQKSKQDLTLLLVNQGKFLQEKKNEINKLIYKTDIIEQISLINGLKDWIITIESKIQETKDEIAIIDERIILNDKNIKDARKDVENNIVPFNIYQNALDIITSSEFLLNYYKSYGNFLSKIKEMQTDIKDINIDFEIKKYDQELPIKISQIQFIKNNNQKIILNAENTELYKASNESLHNYYNPSISVEDESENNKVSEKIYNFFNKINPYNIHFDISFDSEEKKYILKSLYLVDIKSNEKHKNVLGFITNNYIETKDYSHGIQLIMDSKTTNLI